MHAASILQQANKCRSVGEQQRPDKRNHDGDAESAIT
jgi:hypothetical protein